MTHKDLEVYKLSLDLVEEIYSLLRTFLLLKIMG